MSEWRRRGGREREREKEAAEEREGAGGGEEGERKACNLRRVHTPRRAYATRTSRGTHTPPLSPSSLPLLSLSPPSFPFSLPLSHPSPPPPLSLTHTPQPTPGNLNYGRFKRSNFNICSKSWNYRGRWHQTCPLLAFSVVSVHRSFYGTETSGTPSTARHHLRRCRLGSLRACCLP